ncbi:MAG: TlpA family protein disulfide reductase [Methylococcaceae bacterium]|nr:TlpA family protein disulfide reductase [Methylococcaceae bacterium]
MNRLYTNTLGIALALGFSLSAHALELEQAAPEFSLPQLSSGKMNSLSQYRGKVIYLDFWASWCAPCRTSFPLLEKLYQANKDKGFALVAINMDEDLEAANSFLKSYPATFDILRDAEGKWADDYGVETMPTSFIIDKKGIVRHIHSGFAKDDIADIEKIVTKLLAESL